MQRQRSMATIALWRLAVLAGAIALWFALWAIGIFPATLVPNPWEVLVTFVRELPTVEFWQALGLTVYGALLGLVIAAIVGIIFGVITGTFAAADLSTRFLVDFGRAFPAVALVAVLVLILGRGTELKATLVFVAVVFPIIVQTQHGVRRVPQSVIETARAFRIPPGLLVRRVMLPSAAPSILTGLRLAASVAILVAISVEVLTGSPGIGERITAAQLGGNAPVAFAYIVTAGLLGFAVNAGLERLQAVLLRWRPVEGAED